MGVLGAAAGRAGATIIGAGVRINNARVRAADPITDNPRDPSRYAWHHALVAAFDDIRSEWDSFAAAGGRLPHIEDVLGEHQGNVGPWRVGLLVNRGVPCAEAQPLFPKTLAALADVEGLQAALWSVIEAGTELTEHCGPNAGVLRYHLGVDCPAGSALRVGDLVVPYEDRVGILFDDTARHAAWNRSDRTRVTLFAEIVRPLDGVAALGNRLTQRLLEADARRRDIGRRAAEWHAALNPPAAPPP
jgi:beta-hydroxylase